MPSIFKDIIDKKIKAEIIYEDDDILCFKDVKPVAPIHLLIIPKKEIKTVNDVQDSDVKLLGKLFTSAKKIASKLNIDKDGYRLVVNCNKIAGQTVYHLHMHLIAGRKLNWPPG